MIPGVGPVHAPEDRNERRAALFSALRRKVEAHLVTRGTSFRWHLRKAVDHIAPIYGWRRAANYMWAHRHWWLKTSGRGERSSENVVATPAPKRLTPYEACDTGTWWDYA